MMHIDFPACRAFLTAADIFAGSAPRQRQGCRGDLKDATGFSVDTDAEHWMAKRWLSKDGRRDGILVWNADEKPHRFSVKCAGVFESVRQPGVGAVEVLSPVPANSLRLYLYRRTAPRAKQ